MQRLIFIHVFVIFSILLLLSQEPLKHEVFVGVKLIEIYATDKSGEPIKDLQKDEIEILDNGEPQPLAYFEKKEYQLLTEKEEELPITRRKIFFLFDFANNTKKGILRAKEAALHFISSQTNRSDLLGVISYSYLRGIKCHEYLTSDKEKIKKVIKELGVKEIVGQIGRLHELYYQDELQLDSGLGPENAGEKFSGGKFENILANPNLELEKRATEAQVREYSSVLANLAKALRYIPGNKHIIFFSTGIDSSFIYGERKFSPTFSDWDSNFNIPNTVLREFYEKMAAEFASSNCLIYTLNTEGIPASRQLTSGLAQSGEHSLVRLSQLTGGKYYPNTEDLRPAMEDIAKRTSFYYVLGIPVKEEMDGKFHKIEVKVKRKGVKVHAPTGYYNPKPFSQYTDFEKFLHLVDSALSEKPLLQEVKEFPLSLNPVDSEKNIFEIFFEISTKELLEGDEGIEVVIIFFDSKREIIKVKREKVEDISNAERFTYKRVIELPSNTEEVRIVVRNLSSGRSLRGIAKKG